MHIGGCRIIKKVALKLGLFDSQIFRLVNQLFIYKKVTKGFALANSKFYIASVNCFATLEVRVSVERRCAELC